jgi:hypothetical protein
VHLLVDLVGDPRSIPEERKAVRRHLVERLPGANRPGNLPER